MTEVKTFTNVHKAKRALNGLFIREDLIFWARLWRNAELRGFLPKTWPVVYQKRARYALDCSTVQIGDVLQLRGAESGKRQSEEWWRIIDINDTQIEYTKLGEHEVAAYLHSG